VREVVANREAKGRVAGKARCKSESVCLVERMICEDEDLLDRVDRYL